MTFYLGNDGNLLVVCGDFNIDSLKNTDLYKHLESALKKSGSSFNVDNAYKKKNGKFDITTMYGHSVINDCRGRHKEVSNIGEAIDHVFLMTPKSDFFVYKVFCFLR